MKFALAFGYRDGTGIFYRYWSCFTTPSIHIALIVVYYTFTGHGLSRHYRAMPTTLFQRRLLRHVNSLISRRHYAVWLPPA